MPDPIPYAGWTNATALEASPFNWGGGALSNIMGTTAGATGADSVSNVATAQKTSPETVLPNDYGSSGFLASVLDFVNPTSSEKTKATAEQGISSGFKTVLWSVLLVVIALLLFSRGLGLLGEEGAGIVVDLASPEKYPGIGHAVRGIKGRK